MKVKENQSISCLEILPLVSFYVQEILFHLYSCFISIEFVNAKILGCCDFKLKGIKVAYDKINLT